MDRQPRVAGHKVLEADDDARRALFEETRDYLADFETAVGQSSSKEELVERVQREVRRPALPIVQVSRTFSCCLVRSCVGW